jgi:hypothetical protein
VERSPGTVRSYAFDLRDFFWFLERHGLEWTRVSLKQFGRFVGWLRLPPTGRRGSVAVLPSVEAHCCATILNRKLSAVATFYEFDARDGVNCGDLLTLLRRGGTGGAWRPFLAHLGESSQRRKTIKLRPREGAEETGCSAIIPFCAACRA